MRNKRRAAPSVSPPPWGADAARRRPWGRSYASKLLTWSAQQALTQNVFVLKSAAAQDQLLWRAVPQGESSNAFNGRVPEPMSLALAAAALGGLALTRRRRTR